MVGWWVGGFTHPGLPLDLPPAVHGQLMRPDRGTQLEGDEGKDEG